MIKHKTAEGVFIEQNTPEKLFYSLSEFCAVTTLSRTSAWRAIKAGEVRTTKIGHRTLVPAVELKRLAGE